GFAGAPGAHERTRVVEREWIIRRIAAVGLGVIPQPLLGAAGAELYLGLQQPVIHVVGVALAQPRSLAPGSVVVAGARESERVAVALRFEIRALAFGQIRREAARDLDRIAWRGGAQLRLHQAEL